MRKNVVRYGIVAAGTAGAAAAALLASTASATSASDQTDAAKPTVVLVHGGFADASASWNGVIKQLQRDGYPVVAPANPLRGLPADAPYLASVLKSIKGPIILAGHSYGGAVITNAAADNPNVKALVYVAGGVAAREHLDAALSTWGNPRGLGTLRVYASHGDEAVRDFSRGGVVTLCGSQQPLKELA
ncbi:hypothetical protein SLUN_03170 [Streptomyces lunaelactis]|uniref:AB hydrolase-1 domain-containing protein n=1 Tax=Streptomyces lunaelactis TaxID=1535768 RepID=A0A2R4TDL3_9ACTN|nr:alpha/beta fold hydrolase [Streptomyces lunaelactis]AVZ77195.1 hypothetical protein SLUN_03170 [Streptomyces lunaelactis]NUK83655.1 alpha/beta fold hydrolase [Streptomyces lunaelactis]